MLNIFFYRDPVDGDEELWCIHSYSQGRMTRERWRNTLLTIRDAIEVETDDVHVMILGDDDRFVATLRYCPLLNQLIVAAGSSPVQDFPMRWRAPRYDR